MGLGFFPGLGFGLGFSLPRGKVCPSAAGLTSGIEDHGNCLPLDCTRSSSKSRGCRTASAPGKDGRLCFFTEGRSDLRLTGSGDDSFLFSNMDINEVVGGREVVSVARLSTLDRADRLATELLLEATSIGCRRGDPFNVLVFPPLSPPDKPPPPPDPEATAPVPGLALLLAASVAAIKLALFESVVFPLPPPPMRLCADDENGLLPSSEGRKRAWRSLSLSAASPRKLDDPVFCLLIPTVPPVVCLLS